MNVTAIPTTQPWERACWVLAIAATIALDVRPRITSCGCWSHEEMALARVEALAYEAFPAWRAERPTRDCPATLDELLPWMNTEDLLDPWGEPFHFGCTRRGLVVWSAGPDGASGTADDIRSDR